VCSSVGFSMIFDFINQGLLSMPFFILSIKAIASSMRGPVTIEICEPYEQIKLKI
jgi:hypothetical protein